MQLQTYLILGILFMGLAAYAYKKQTPMWLWPGTEINAGKLTDVKHFNRCIAIAWAVYAIPYWIAALIQGQLPHVASLLITAAATIGFLLLGAAFLVIWWCHRNRNH